MSAGDVTAGARSREPQQRLPARQRRAVISRAALEVFAEQGFGDASLEEIATRAGVTKPLLYRHFHSKSAIYTALLESEVDALLAAVRAAARAEPSAPLEASVDAFFAHLEERPFARRLLFRDPGADADVADAHARSQDELTKALASLLASNPRLLASDPQRALTIDLFAQLVKTALSGVAAWWYSHPETDRGTIVERTMQLLTPGLRDLEEPVG